jgi:hypothetical protein
MGFLLQETLYIIEYSMSREKFERWGRQDETLRFCCDQNDGSMVGAARGISGTTGKIRGVLRYAQNDKRVGRA